MSASNASTLCGHLVSSWSTVEKRTRFTPSPRLRHPPATEILSQPKERVNPQIAARLISLLTAQGESRHVLNLVQPYIESLLADPLLSPSSSWPVATLCSSIRGSDLEARFPGISNPLDQLVERLRDVYVSSSILRQDPTFATPLEIAAVGQCVAPSNPTNPSINLAPFREKPHYIPDISSPDPFDYRAHLGLAPPSSQPPSANPVSDPTDNAITLASATKSLASVANNSSRPGIVGRVAGLVLRNNPIASKTMSRSSRHSVAAGQSKRLGRSQNSRAGFPDLNRLRPTISKYGAAASASNPSMSAAALLPSQRRLPRLTRRPMSKNNGVVVDLDGPEQPSMSGNGESLAHDPNNAEQHDGNGNDAPNVMSAINEGGTLSSPNQAASTDNEIIDLTAEGCSEPEPSHSVMSLPSLGPQPTNSYGKATRDSKQKPLPVAASSSILGRLQAQMPGAAGCSTDLFEDDDNDDAGSNEDIISEDIISAHANINATNGVAETRCYELAIETEEVRGRAVSNGREALGTTTTKTSADLERVRQKMREQKIQNYRKSLAITDEKKIPALTSIPNEAALREERRNERIREKVRVKRKQQEAVEGKTKKKLEEKKKRLSLSAKRGRGSSNLDDDDDDDNAVDGNDEPDVVMFDESNDKRHRTEDGRRVTRSFSQ